MRAGDQHRFTLLLEECRSALDAAGADDGKDYHLSVALTADPLTAEGIHEGNDGLEHGQLSNLLDFASIMTFDYAGAWDDYSAHQSPLHQNPNNPNENAADWNIESGLQYYVDNGWDPSQLNMATPFYGRSFAASKLQTARGIAPTTDCTNRLVELGAGRSPGHGNERYLRLLGHRNIWWRARNESG
ncbi:glycosyl hydrolase family 18 protein [Halocatena marina]|uniref:glycosyl hydrolase family 18 protein n=1 Tax=Halocatena marina TaxID=2934937 RepID=UPI00361BA33C